MLLVGVIKVIECMEMVWNGTGTQGFISFVRHVIHFVDNVRIVLW